MSATPDAARDEAVGVTDLPRARDVGPADNRGELRRRRKSRLARTRIPFLRAIGPLLILVVWEIASATGLLNPTVLPSPAGVVSAAYGLAQDGTLANAVLVSARRAMLGLGIGVVTGVVLALASGLSRIGTALIDGTVQLWRSIPILAIIPIVIVWIGIGETMKVSLIAVASIVPIYINTSSALLAIDQRYVELADTLRLGRWDFIRYVALPGAIPGFFTGLRLASVTCWLVLVVVEQTNATAGIGYFMGNAQQFGEVGILTVGVVLYALLGLTSDTIVMLLQRRALRWRKGLGE